MKKNKIYNKIKIFSIIFSSFLFFPFCSKAAPLMSNASKDCREVGNCEVKDFIRLFSGGYEFILGIVGSLALLMVVIGGGMFLISGGSPEKIAKGKKVIVSAFIGLAIVFTSYIIIEFILEGLGR